MQWLKGEIVNIYFVFTNCFILKSSLYEAIWRGKMDLLKYLPIHTYGWVISTPRFEDEIRYLKYLLHLCYYSSIVYCSGTYLLLVSNPPSGKLNEKACGICLLFPVNLFVFVTSKITYCTCLYKWYFLIFPSLLCTYANYAMEMKS
jgi:hypothetical protein